MSPDTNIRCESDMKKLLIVLLLAASIIGISVFSTYVVRRDEIAARRHTVEQAWNHVNSAIQRRADLVPDRKSTRLNSSH